MVKFTKAAMFCRNKIFLSKEILFCMFFVRLFFRYNFCKARDEFKESKYFGSRFMEQNIVDPGSRIQNIPDPDSRSQINADPDSRSQNIVDPDLRSQIIADLDRGAKML